VDLFLNMLLYIYRRIKVNIYMITIFVWVESVKIIFLSYFLWNQFSVWLLIPMFLYFLWKECVCVSVCLHRYFSHKGFHVHRFTQFIMGIMSCLALQGPPIWWASKHRRHHKHCDTIKDPHSPIAFSKLYAWVGWVYLGTENHIDEMYVKDLIKYPELVFLDKFFPFINWTEQVLCWWIMGAAWSVYVSMWSGLLSQLIILHFNVTFHDNINSIGTCKAKDAPTDIFVNIFGEAYHNWHHKHPTKFKRPGLDLPYWLCIKPCFRIGVFKKQKF